MYGDYMTKTGRPSKQWVYNIDTGSITRKIIVCKANEMETWYEDTRGNTYEAFHIDKTKKYLVDRISHHINCEIAEALNNVKKLSKLLVKIKKV